jgi:hypothetical protein
VLFGVNGSGKSSVLAACAAVLSEILVESQRHEEDGIWRREPQDTDVRRGVNTLSLQATLSNWDITQYHTVRHTIGKRHGRLIGNHAAALSSSDAPILCVFYEAAREVAAAKDAFAPVQTEGSALWERPQSAFFDALAVGHLKFRSLFLWFKAREDVENELKVSTQNLSLEDPLLSAVRRAVAGMLPGYSGLRIQRDPLHMTIRKGDITLVIDQLSDGEKLLLALTADLARRLALAYADKEDPLKGEAVVLIDEIELHLHPAWQRRVLGALKSTFPGCQFIVTTHSPQVLSEVPNDAVVLVKDFQFFRPAAPTEGRDSNSILWEVLDVSARPAHIVNDLDLIKGLLDEGKSEEARKRIDHLAEVLTERDTEIGRLRSLLDLTERLDASDHEGA